MFALWAASATGIVPGTAKVMPLAKSMLSSVRLVILRPISLYIVITKTARNHVYKHGGQFVQYC